MAAFWTTSPAMGFLFRLRDLLVRRWTKTGRASREKLEEALNNGSCGFMSVAEGRPTATIIAWTTSTW